MTTEEEVRQENEYLWERVRLQQEKIELQQTLFEQCAREAARSREGRLVMQETR
jgi:hypothetical protein